MDGQICLGYYSGLHYSGPHCCKNEPKDLSRLWDKVHLAECTGPFIISIIIIITIIIIIILVWSK